MSPFHSPAKHALTPAELVLLHGDQFAKQATFGKVQLLHTETAVSAAELGQAVLLAAFLAAEQSGDLAFETRQESKLLGFRKVQTLVAVPGASDGTWPENTLESALCRSTRTLVHQGKNEVRTIVYEWLGEDSGVPWREVVEKLKEAMAARGLLQAQEEKKLKVLSVTRYSLPEATAALRNEEALQPVRKLIEDCRQGRPELFNSLEKQLNSAIRARTDQDAAG